jgi:uncharacterized protein YecE (DUF72 family)
VIRVGTSGWSYPDWRGKFYPKGLVQRRELAYLASHMNSTEINGSFYSLQRPSSYDSWRSQVPDDFLFAIKGGRFITHMKRLRDVEAPLATFFASGVYRLGPTLGPILWQLPPTLRYDPDLLAAFFDQLPRKHDAGPIRHAIEVRHPSFKEPGFLDLLREHAIALVIADTAGKFPYLEDVTTDFTYLRLHGDTELYTSNYSDKALMNWAHRIRTLAKAAGGDAYVYFDNDNDSNAHAPHNAITLAAMLN